MPQRKVWTIVLLALVVGGIFGAALTVGALDVATPGTDEPAADDPVSGDSQQPADLEPAALLEEQGTIQQFGTAEAFVRYVQSARRSIGRGGFGLGARPRAGAGGNGNGNGVGGGTSADSGGGSPSSTGPDRVAETNVQVEGLDEPDTVKTDGENFYREKQAECLGVVRESEILGMTRDSVSRTT
jgi:hypothetical protein